MTDPTTPSAFATWLSRHPCTREELWKIQNMLGDCLPDSELHESALEAWLESSKHTFPDPHWDEGCIKCGGFDGEPCEPPETRTPFDDPKFTSSAEWAWSTLKFEEIKFKAEEVEEFIYDLLVDHARLIEAVEKKEGIKAFSDLHFPPAA